MSEWLDVVVVIPRPSFECADNDVSSRMFRARARVGAAPGRQPHCRLLLFKTYRREQFPILQIRSRFPRSNMSLVPVIGFFRAASLELILKRGVWKGWCRLSDNDSANVSTFSTLKQQSTRADCTKHFHSGMIPAQFD